MPLKPGIGLYLKVLSKSLQQHANCQLQDRDLTFGQSRLLMVLGSRPDHTASMKELQELFHSAQSTVCGIVSRMEKKGLIEAIACPGDRRVKRIHLTEAGIAMRETCISDMHASEAWLTAALSEEEHTQLEQLLRRMCEGKWNVLDHQETKKETEKEA